MARHGPNTPVTVDKRVLMGSLMAHKLWETKSVMNPEF